jgi:hypothetical protein
MRPLADVISVAFADELDVAPDSLVARIAGETTAVALLEANARAARGDVAFNGMLETVLDFVGGGVAALRK